MKKFMILFLSLFFVNISGVMAYGSFYTDEQHMTCAYELKYENANDYDREFLNSLNVKATDGGPLTYNSLILEVTYVLPSTSNDLWHHAQTMLPMNLNIYSMDAFEKKTEVFVSENSGYDEFCNNGSLEGTVTSCYETYFFVDKNNKNRFYQPFVYGLGKNNNIVYNREQEAQAICKHLNSNCNYDYEYTISKNFNGANPERASNDKLREAYCGEEIHVMSAFVYKSSGHIVKYLLPMVCGYVPQSDGKWINTCNEMYKNWEYYSKSGKQVFGAFITSGISDVQINGPTKYIFKESGYTDLNQLDTDLKNHFEEYYEVCNYSEANKDNYDAKECRAKYGAIDGEISSLMGEGYTKEELLNPVIQAAEAEYNACDYENNVLECEKKRINVILSKFNKVEITIAEGLNYTQKGEEYYCDQEQVCIANYISSAKVENSAATKYCEEMCNLYKSTHHHYEEAEKEALKFNPLLYEEVIDFFGGGTCDSFLGNPQDNVNKPPAYYLQFIFNLIKYLSIVLLVVLSIVDFLTAITSGKDDDVKKATNKAFKRLIIVIIIFFLPILVEFILKLLGIYSASTCGIK